MIQKDTIAEPHTPERSLLDSLDLSRLPRHVAVIMDGNGRWAQRRRLPRVEGHRAGIASVRGTAGCRGMVFNIALNYSGRAEIADAARAIAEDVRAGRMAPEDVDEAAIQSRLYTAGLPDPDLLIRTSGEMRISNYLLWQIAYAELYVTETLWPDFTRAELLRAILDYQKRHRRFGGLGVAELGDEPAGDSLLEPMSVPAR